MDNIVINIEPEKIDEYIKRLENLRSENINDIQPEIKALIFYNKYKSKGYTAKKIENNTKALLTISESVNDLIKNTIIFLSDAIDTFAGIESKLAKEIIGRF